MTVGSRAIKRGKASQVVDGKDFRLADEIRYIQDKAADHDLRMVTIGQFILFSTETGDAWLLDVTDKLAVRLARDGDPEPIHLKETDSSLVIGWKGHYQIEGPAFIYSDRDTGRVTTIIGYPTKKIAQAG
jgi:hypothetical protein